MFVLCSLFALYFIENEKNGELKIDEQNNFDINTNKKIIIKPAKAVEDSPLPLIKTGSSMMPDMMFGWKPEVKTSNPPIPLYFDFVNHRMHIYHFGRISREREGPFSDVFVYQQRRFNDSYQMHKTFANQ